MGAETPHSAGVKSAMAAQFRRTRSPRRRIWRYVGTLVLFVVLAVGWSWLWHYAAGKAEATVEGWRAREAKSGRLYTCGSQTVGGYPFRIEINCDKAAALFRSNQPPVEVKTSGILVAAQVYQPTLLISEFHGPLTIADPGKAPNIIVNWKLAQSSVRGTPAAPERVSLVFDKPVVDRTTGGGRENILTAKHIEVHGRIVEGSAIAKPVIEVVLRLAAASAPTLHPAAAAPVDADITGVLRGLNDFAPKPWPVRFRELQAAGGRIDITQARVQQGETIAVGGGSLSLNANGRLEGQLRVTVAGIEPFLASIGAQRAVQTSPDMNKVAGALDRLLPGLGGVARQQAGTSMSLGINLLGEQTTLEGKRAVTLPLRFDDGSIFLGPIRIGNAPALF
jgi:hypothetical protein